MTMLGLYGLSFLYSLENQGTFQMFLQSRMIWGTSASFSQQGLLQMGLSDKKMCNWWSFATKTLVPTAENSLGQGTESSEESRPQYQVLLNLTHVASHPILATAGKGPYFDTNAKTSWVKPCPLELKVWWLKARMKWLWGQVHAQGCMPRTKTLPQPTSQSARNLPLCAWPTFLTIPPSFVFL